MELRQYQKDAANAVWQAWYGPEPVDRTFITLSTGLGKTVIFSAITNELVRRGRKVLIIAHRGELLTQGKDKLEAFFGLSGEIEKAESHASPEAPVVFGSIQTLARRCDTIPPDMFDAIIVDECHHIMSETYQKVMEYFSGAKVLGVTATPDRADKKNIGKYFQTCAFEYGLREAIRNGYLSPITVEFIPLKLDLSDVKIQNGDYSAAESANAIEPYLEQIATEMARHCKDRKTIVFLPLIAISQEFRDILNRHGFRAVEVNGNSPDRAEILQDFADGKYNVLTNATLLTEGYDCPSVDCVVMLRPTKSRGLYTQAVGRGTRLYPGKQNLLLLDFLWLTGKHDLCRPVSIVAKSDEEKKKMQEILEKDGEGDLDELEEKADKDIVEEREKALAEALALERKRQRKTVDPLQYAVSIEAEDLLDYAPFLDWEKEPPTQKQLADLDKFGIDSTVVTCKGHASMIIGKLKERIRNDLTTPKQIRFLERKGFRRVGTWKFEDASKMISRIANCGWMVPRGVDPETYKP